MPEKKKIFIIISALLLILLGIRIFSAESALLIKETRILMDTYVTISALAAQPNAKQTISLAFDRMQEINVKFNSLNPKSQIYAFNQEGIPISDAEILGLIRKALEVSSASEGAFDITVGPLMELWGFYEKSSRLPREEEIKERLKVVGYKHLLLKDGALSKDLAGVKIDLGGIAKGYAISQAAGVLKRQGIKSALIDAGGDIYALGRKGRKLWKVGIMHPRQKDILGYLEVEETSVISSGDYQRFFKKGKKRYHHIFNPKTGYPTEGVSAVTLIYTDPVLAQAWAKVPFVLGPKKGLEFLEAIAGMEALIIPDTGEKIYSRGFKHRLIPAASAN